MLTRKDRDLAANECAAQVVEIVSSAFRHIRVLRYARWLQEIARKHRPGSRPHMGVQRVLKTRMAHESVRVQILTAPLPLTKGVV